MKITLRFLRPFAFFVAIASAVFSAPDPATGEIAGTYLTLESNETAREFTLYSVLWPERGAKSSPLTATLAPDGKTDHLALTDTALTLN